MNAFTRWLDLFGHAVHGCLRSVSVFSRDVSRGLVAVSHNTLSLVGLVLVVGALIFLTRGELRKSLETQAFDWLLARHEARLDPAQQLAAELSEPGAVARATAVDPRTLPRQQALVAQWLSRRYRVAPEPISRIVKEAWYVGDRTGLEPTLILAIMALESSFNPFAQSPVGAQGLMQVMTRVHDNKYRDYGGTHAAFDPVTNLRVGVQVLKECIARAGSLEAGLRAYVGAANLPDDGGYSARVLAEKHLLSLVAQGKAVAVTAPLPPVLAPAPAAVPAPAAPTEPNQTPEQAASSSSQPSKAQAVAVAG